MAILVQKSRHKLLGPSDSLQHINNLHLCSILTAIKHLNSHCRNINRYLTPSNTGICYQSLVKEVFFWRNRWCFGWRPVSWHRCSRLAGRTVPHDSTNEAGGGFSICWGDFTVLNIQWLEQTNCENFTRALFNISLSSILLNFNAFNEFY